MNRASPHTLGAASLLASTVIFAVMALLVKYVQTEGIDIYKVTLFRFAIGGILLATLAMLGIIRLEFHSRFLLFLRGLLGGAAVFLYFLSIFKIGLAKGTVISSSSPIFATIGGIVFLGEENTLKKWMLVLAAFAGIILIASGRDGGLAGFGVWEALAVTGAVMAGGAYVVIRILAATDTPYAIFMSQCAIGFWLVVIPANLKECQVGISGGVLLLLVGLCAAAGQLLMTWAFKHVRVSTGSLLGLLTTVINVFVGILLFGEKLLPVGIAGCVLVIAACALIVLVEKAPVAPAPSAR